MIQRQTAYKVFIGDLLSGEYVKELGEWDPNYLLIKDKKVSRINIVASVISKFETPEQYVSLDVDDGSGVISLKTWKEDVKLFDGVKIGDLVLVVGRVRQYNDQIYVTPEIVKVLQDFGWSKLRKLELERIWGKREEVKVGQEKKPELVVTEEAVTETSRQKVLNIIEKEEVDLKRVVELSNLNSDEVKVIVQNLLKEGEIFEPRPGVLKII